MPSAYGTVQGTRAASALAVVVLLILIGGGLGQVALMLLAAVGVASGILLAAGLLQTSHREETNRDAERIVEALPVPVAVTNGRGVLLWQSKGFASYAVQLGFTGQAHPGVTNPGSQTQAALFRLFSAARQGRASTETVPAAEMDGASLAISVAPVAGRERHATLLVWRVAEEKQTPETDALGVIDLLPLPAFVMRDGIGIERANRMLEQLLGREPGALSPQDVFCTRSGEPVSKARFRAMMAKADGDMTVHLRSASGRPKGVTLSVSPWPHDDAGRRLCIVTPPALGAANLQDGFETLVANVPQPMTLVSAKGIVLAANEAFQQIFAPSSPGSERGTVLVGKGLSSILPPEVREDVRDKIASLIAGTEAKPGSAELNVLVRDQPDKRVRLVLSQTADNRHVIVQANEIATEPVIDEKTVQSQKLQAVGELAGGIAHDFNNLLTAIIGFSDLLLRRFKASDPAFKDLMNIKNNATRAAELVKQILAYSRRQTLRPALLKVTDVIEEFNATMGRTLGERVKATIQHGRDLWFVKADEGQLFQVIMNLAVNARDAMPAGGELTIKTANVTERESLGLRDRGLERGEYVMCEIRDTGVGIKPEHLAKIFDPFFSTKEVGKGTGLGLSTVYGIVKQTGGTIVVDSELGVGTSFRIYLPRYVETEDDLKALQSKPETLDKAADLTGHGTVLLVEDEDAVRSFASRALSTRGYTVLEAASGVEALEIMDRENGRIDLVVSDVVMPEMDGPTLLRHLRERNPGIRIVFMSGYAEEAFRKNLSMQDNFVFLPKPFTLKKLAETVKAAAA